MSAPVRPVAEPSRLAVLDAVRGVSLFGILIANIMVFSGVVYLDAATRDALPLAKIDAVVRWLQVILVEGKFYGLFSLLFGIGAALQLGDGHDAARRARFRRRMLVLAAIGLLHSVVWPGDILLFYAVLGFLLPACARLEPARLLRVGLALFVVAGVWQVIFFDGPPLVGLPSMWPFSLAIDHLAPHYATMDAAQARGDFATLFRYNLTAIWADRWAHLLLSGRQFKVFGFFLIGIWIVRKDILRALPEYRSLLVRVARMGVPIGVSAGFVFAAGRFSLLGRTLGTVTPFAESLGILALTLGYAACLVLMWERYRPASMRIFQPLGQMALTTYLTQTVICLFGLSGLGVGWFMEIGATMATALAVPVIAVQLLFAHWWMARFQFGPAEWLWRSLTYGTRQPMRRR